MYSYDFRLVGYPLRLYSGKDALENLPAEVKRQRAARAFIVCGRAEYRAQASSTKWRRSHRWRR